ncbi:CLUMA_CG000414, isoform A [Clunio marinus]|uniref:CLUMA_CG000414, isoform A n=1 Tax=Clunio marinus TaxID=568069 RepID=A0A1J1HJU3_9DIPT|nr:CLUMA_CG000414, isoform A [Clunio marinus]
MRLWQPQNVFPCCPSFASSCRHSQMKNFSKLSHHKQLRSLTIATEFQATNKRRQLVTVTRRQS